MPSGSTELDLVVTATDGTQYEVTVEVLGPPACRSCGDTGFVAPDAFGDWTPWLVYVAQIEALHQERGYPPESSAIAAGLLHPMPCPDCSGSAHEKAPSPRP